MKCCDITPAKLNRKVSLYRLDKTPTDTGGFEQSWFKVADLWASIKNMSGTELVRADQLGATSYSDFTIRYRSNIDETMKIVYRGTDYQIRHINNIEEADRWLMIKAEKGVTQ